MHEKQRHKYLLWHIVWVAVYYELNLMARCKENIERIKLLQFPLRRGKEIKAAINLWKQVVNNCVVKTITVIPKKKGRSKVISFLIFSQ